ncbi:hypothetical protein HK104_004035 [Borealophlyctis nickersoniae]|nr:hypothetical protein HK104_004035 [Borealophlyctis nickersoniae]
MILHSALIPALSAKHPLLKVHIHIGDYVRVEFQIADGVSAQQIVETYSWAAGVRSNILRFGQMFVPKPPKTLLSFGNRVSDLAAFYIYTFPDVMHSMAEEMGIHAPESLAWCIRTDAFHYWLHWEVTEEEEKVPAGVKEDQIVVKGMARAAMLQ